jgi:hypothetical protein
MAGGTEFSEQKFKELFLYLAAQSRSDQGYAATKLNKLLYFCDFEAFRLLGHAITGATYQKFKWGPAAREFLPMQDDLLQWEAAQVLRRKRGRYEQKVTVALWEPNMSIFSGPEIEIIDAVITELRPFDAKGSSDYAHEKSAGWNLVNEGEPIPYDTAFISTDPVPPEDLEQARQYVRDRGWITVRP